MDEFGNVSAPRGGMEKLPETESLDTAVTEKELGGLTKAITRESIRYPKETRL